MSRDRTLACRATIAILVVIAFVYLGGVFIELAWSPAAWSMEGRINAVLAAAFAATFVAGLCLVSVTK